MKKIVIKFGGSVLYKENMTLNIDLIKNIVDVINTLYEEGHFVSAVIDFLIIAFVVFVLMKQIEKTGLK